MKSSLLQSLAVTSLVGALALALGAGVLPGVHAPSAAATQGAIDLTAIDADPTTPGIQPCRSVKPGDTFFVDLIVGPIEAADSNNFASGGNVGLNFDTADFTSPGMDFGPGALDDVAELTSFPLATSKDKAPGITHFARAYLTDPNVSAPNVVGRIVAARATLTAGSGTGIKTIRVTKSAPLDGSFDFFMGASPTVQPTTVQSASIAIGTSCPVTNPPSASPPTVSTGPDTSQTLTLTATDADGNCPLAFSIASGPSNGDLGEITDVSCTNGTATAKVVYTPRSGFTGTDTFTYRVSDGTNESEDVKASVLVGSEEPQPTAGDSTPPDPTDAASQTSDDGDTDWALIAVIAAAAAVATAAAGTAVWWRLRQPGRPREG